MTRADMKELADSFVPFSVQYGQSVSIIVPEHGSRCEIRVRSNDMSPRSARQLAKALLTVAAFLESKQKAIKAARSTVESKE